MSNDIIFELIEKERERQTNGIELIASENFVSENDESHGKRPTNKYAEGYPGKRYYGGCEVVDEVETLAIEKSKTTFRRRICQRTATFWFSGQCSHLSFSLKPGDTVMGMDLSMGGHLTHGSHVNFRGINFRPVFYGVEKKQG